MRRSWLFLVMVGALAASSCGPGQVAVTAELEVPDPEMEGATLTRPIAELEVQFIPFDRDGVFDSLTSAFPTPEPEIPADLLAAQQEIAEAQAAWQAAEATWGSGRDRLQQISDELQTLNRAEARYVTLFNEFQDRERRVAQAERAKDQAFRTFTELQEGFIQRRDSMRIVKAQWADEAFAAVTEVFIAKAREAGQDFLVDTTDAQGYMLTDVPPGQWWVYAFYEQAYTELYWNLPITVERGAPVEVRLNPETAEVRPVF
ncbi:MAG: hypothetical protein HKO65_03210 [Gemmatimonadetes bacterium]|nr:hypothetical protein [Gemmatimonadota bacterium]NNM04087.1 hypothetical protein [Gemmatimonadota bacterium]